MSAAFNAADVQGNILRGYRKPWVRYLILEVTERAAARRWLAATLSKRDGIPQITTEEPWVTKPDTCFNIGLTYEGLRALGTPGSSLETFPTEFIDGMTSRAVKLGDVEQSAPKNWPAPFDNPKRLHLIASIYADETSQIDRIQQQALPSGSGLSLLGTRNGWSDDGNFVHFGYRDSIAQPKFKEIHDPADYADGQPPAPLGTVLLGYETNFENLLFRVPTPCQLGFNGSFNAFRVLAQDVVGFEQYLDKAACDLLRHPHVEDLLAIGAEATIGTGLTRKAALREIVAATMCGRWRNGVPLALSPNTPNPNPSVPFEDFDYTETSTCP